MNLSNPDNTFYVMEDYGIDHNNAGDEPERVFFSSLVSQVAMVTVVTIHFRWHMDNVTYYINIQ